MDPENQLSAEEKAKLSPENEAMISVEQQPVSEAQLEQLRQEIEKNIEEKIEAFRADDSKIDAIAAQFNLQNQADVFSAKSEINFDHQLREINIEAENLKSEALTELGALHEGEATAESNQAEKDPAQEKYEKEILPMLQILKPDDVPLEAYEAEMMNELFEDAKKLQVAQGKMVENPESTMHDIKVMLHERAKALVAASHDYSIKERPSEKSEAVRKAKIALLFEGDYEEMENYFGKKDPKELSDLYNLRSYISSNLTKSEMDGLMKTPLAEGIMKNSDPMYFYYDRKEGLPESVLVAAAKNPDESGRMYRVIVDALKKAEPKEFSEEAFRILAENGKAENAVMHLGAFKSIDVDALAASGIFSGSYIKDKISYVKNAPIDESLQKDILQKGLVSYLSKGNFYNFEEHVVEFGVGLDNVRSPEMQDAGVEGLKNFLGKGKWNDIKRAIEILAIPPEKIASPEIRQAAEASLGNRVAALSYDNTVLGVDNLNNYATIFAIDDSLVKEELLRQLPDLAPKMSIRSMTLLLEKYDIAESLHSPEVKRELVLSLQYLAKCGDLEDLRSFKKRFSYLENEMDTPEMRSIVSESLNKQMNDFNIHKMRDYISTFPFIEETNGGDTFDAAFDMHIEKLAGSETRIQATENLKEAYRAKNTKEKLPLPIIEKLEKFENQYGDKGKNLVTLAIAAYGTRNPEAFAREMERVEAVLNKYDPTCIPEGAHVSMGIEYEATESIANDRAGESAYTFRKDAEIVSDVANIGIGFGGVHEFAPKPTYNPYMLMAEIHLLQEAGLLDFNFKKYGKAARGYHLNLGGDSGLMVDENINFLNNALTLAQLSGVVAGNEVQSSRQVVANVLDIFSDVAQKGVRCEIKGMATDSVEQFEKAILTSHHAGIAIQLYNKYVQSEANLTGIPDSASGFEIMLKEKGLIVRDFASEKEKEIVFAWAKLRSEMADAVEQHNDSFIDSEFGGGFVDKKGEYVDTSEHIDVIRNKNLIPEEVLADEDFKQALKINEFDLVKQQTPEFINAVARTNNIFLKGPQGTNNSSVNAKAALDVMKHEDYGGIMDGQPQDSIFERGGEMRDGYYVVQGASEEMITHKSQILLNAFNREMERLLQIKEVVKTKQQVAA